jgi:hypothetical protein
MSDRHEQVSFTNLVELEDPNEQTANHNHCRTLWEGKQVWLGQFLDLSQGTPSHDTFTTLFARLDPEQLQDGFISWVRAVYHRLKGEGEVVAVDGLRFVIAGQSLAKRACSFSGTMRLGRSCKPCCGLIVRRLGTSNILLKSSQAVCDSPTNGGLRCAHAMV